jgi:hypothetical protein
MVSVAMGERLLSLTGGLPKVNSSASYFPPLEAEAAVQPVIETGGE